MVSTEYHSCLPTLATTENKAEEISKFSVEAGAAGISGTTGSRAGRGPKNPGQSGLYCSPLDLSALLGQGQHCCPLPSQVCHPGPGEAGTEMLL